MIVSIDTNILIQLWSAMPEGPDNAVALDRLLDAGHELIVCGVVRAELAAHPTLSPADIDRLLSDGGIRIDWEMSADIWLEAARVHAEICKRRRKANRRVGRTPEPRRPLADHLIGAHAVHRAGALLTRNSADFSDFQTLTIIAP